MTLLLSTLSYTTLALAVYLVGKVLELVVLRTLSISKARILLAVYYLLVLITVLGWQDLAFLLLNTVP